MPVPETTSAEAFERYVGGKCLVACRGEAWRDRLAAQAGFYFNRLFKSALGMLPSRYHIRLRMDEARRRLRETKRSVVEIALDVGYANPSHFAQLFRRETGLAPGDYRRQR